MENEMTTTRRRHILEPYTVNGRSVRYSVRLRGWIVERRTQPPWGGPEDEWRYFKTKSEAFRFARGEFPEDEWRYFNEFEEGL